jgi:hypothetical protein
VPAASLRLGPGLGPGLRLRPRPGRGPRLRPRPRPRPRRRLRLRLRLGLRPRPRLSAARYSGELFATISAVTPKEKAPAQLIDERIKELGDWRGDTLSRVRASIKEADPDVVEEWKWRGVPTWYHDGIICTGETYKNIVKLTFAKGAALKDPHGLFNSSLEGNVRRAIDFHEGEKVNERALKTLIRAAVAQNESNAKK